MSDEKINGSEMPDPKNATRWSVFNVDMPWPPADVGIAQASAKVPMPARFMRAYAMVKPGLLAGSTPEVTVRMVFVVAIDMPRQQLHFMTMQGESAIGVPNMSEDEDTPQPDPLDVIGHPLNGNPLCIWQLPGPTRLADAPVEQPHEMQAGQLASLIANRDKS